MAQVEVWLVAVVRILQSHCSEELLGLGTAASAVATESCCCSC